MLSGAKLGRRRGQVIVTTVVPAAVVYGLTVIGGGVTHLLGRGRSTSPEVSERGMDRESVQSWAERALMSTALPVYQSVMAEPSRYTRAATS